MCKLKTAIEIKGNLSNPEWKNAEKGKKFARYIDRRTWTYMISFRGLWNDENLYINFWQKNLFQVQIKKKEIIIYLQESYRRTARKFTKSAKQMFPCL